MKMHLGFKKQTTNDWLYAIIMWALLLSGGGFLDYIPPWNVIIPLAIFLILVVETVHSKTKFSKKSLYSLLSILLYIVFLFFLHMHLNADINSYIKIGLNVVIIFLLNHQLADRNRFMELYVKVMLFICIYSCVCYFINMVFNLSEITPWTGTLYKLWMGQNIKHRFRNSGPFWEPGIYMIYIIIALLFTLFYFKNKNGHPPIAYILVYSLTIITTVSTTGYLVFAGLLMWKYVQVAKHARKGQNRVVMLFLLPIVLLLGSVIILSTPAVSDKFVEENISYSTRSSQVREIIPVLRESGAFGKGAQTKARRAVMLRHGVNGNGDTNTVGYSSMASMYGWVTLAFFMFRILYVCRKQFTEHWVLLYGVLLIFWTTGAIMLVPIYFFFFIGFSGDVKKYDMNNNIQQIVHSDKNLKKA